MEYEVVLTVGKYVFTSDEKYSLKRANAITHTIKERLPYAVEIDVAAAFSPPEVRKQCD